MSPLAREGGAAAAQMHDVRDARHDLLVVVSDVDQRHVAAIADVLYQAEHAPPTDQVEALAWLVKNKQRWTRGKSRAHKNQLLLTL